MRTPHESHIRLIESLKYSGLAKYEALVYIALLRVKRTTATEIHESSGVPRAAVYPGVGQLLEKDLVSVSRIRTKTVRCNTAQECGGTLLGIGGIRQVIHAVLRPDHRLDKKERLPQFFFKIQ